MPLPKNYLLGIDVQQRDFENYRQPSYLRGEFTETGWWYYYLYALAIKVPLGTWGLLLLVIVLRLFPRLGATRCSPTSPDRRCAIRDELVLLFPAIVIFILVSMKRKRHLPEQIIKKLREADAMFASGKTIGHACQALEISEQTFHRWRNQYGRSGARLECGKTLRFWYVARRLRDFGLTGCRQFAIVLAVGLATRSKRWFS